MHHLQIKIKVALHSLSTRTVIKSHVRGWVSSLHVDMLKVGAAPSSFWKKVQHQKKDIHKTMSTGVMWHN